MHSLSVSASHFFKRYWRQYALGAAFILLTNILSAWIPMLVKQAVEHLQQQAVTQTVWILAGIALITAIMFVVRVASRHYLIGVGRHVEYDLRKQLFDQLLAMPKSYYDARQTGELMSRMTNDLSVLRMALGGGIMLFLNVLFAYCCFLPMMGLLSWRLTILTFILYPVTMGLMRRLSLQIKNQTHAVQDRLGHITTLAQENFTGMSVIQGYAKETDESARFADANHAYATENIKLVKIRALLFVLIAAVTGLSTLIILGEGGREAIAGEFSLSSLAAFFLYLERITWPTISMGWALSITQQGRAALERVNTMLADKPPPAVARNAQFVNPLTVPISIEVRNLSYRYDNPYLLTEAPIETPRVLSQLSFTIPAGSRVALVGPIGSGKSTLLQLLAKLYPAPNNSIFYNQYPLESISTQTLRSLVQLMPQNAFLFSDTLQHNVAFGKPHTTLDKVMEATQIAHVHQDIMSLPEQYQTTVGERGITLSGGQRQRSTLARTLLMEPEVLFLDDPFAAIDVHTEAQIIDALQQRHTQHAKTTIIATHRFAWVEQTDWVLVLNTAGQLEAQGTHSDLMQQCTLYQKLSQQNSLDKVD